MTHFSDPPTRQKRLRGGRGHPTCHVQRQVARGWQAVHARGHPPACGDAERGLRGRRLRGRLCGRGFYFDGFTVLHFLDLSKFVKVNSVFRRTSCILSKDRELHADYVLP